ncbi:hypothetical protein [Flavobacterium psychrophilum]|uniref:Secreted protein n=1 Tax=Flavobacterium psychrophilum (strain ATCC 49511 / DSM 21280 / CIP 103535 / JIP02/86) TaxID=402612 RepID=A6GZB0_FLAPJ|nr:hypothetical protein [Flavobacterium psychrophilum]AIJ38758.1 Hypothetical protein FPSM_02263 [Flavobacterium psychrophilum]AIN72396.1 hypothetical protein FPG101_11335 [Flavobacterium psychrophilum FPG101]AKC19444.1 hypothetical protein IY36_06780 [Flavobacterium psychrophilum]AKC24184.1 hypothetical protein IY38_06795 [Flavobacterium psychrophilum]AKC28812.1 hypothetical protein IY34_06500 [Flavobacterium psychrophilum]
MKKYFSILVFALISSVTYSQSSLNDYEMAIIPSKFEFQKEDNQYRISSTIKAFLKQKGFEAYVSTDVLPEGFLDYNCNKIFVNVLEENTLFSTRIKIEFKNCKQLVLFTTDLGESREKELGKGYNQALLLALNSFDKARYKFSGKTYYDEEAQEKIKSRDVHSISSEVTKITKSEKGVTYEKVTKQDALVTSEVFVKVVNQANQQELLLYKTSREGIYLCNQNGKNGVVFAKDEVWFFEYLENGKLISEKLDVNF